MLSPSETDGSASAPGTSPTQDAERVPTEQPTFGQSQPESASTCRLLDESELRELAGEALTQSSERTVGEVPQCRWAGAGGDPLVQVMTSSASTWSRSLPPILDQALGHPSFEGDIADLEEASQILAAEGELDDQRSCEVFSAMAEVNGAPAGADTVVNHLTIEGRTAISAQRCAGGHFTSVVLAGFGGDNDAEEAERTLTALRSAHERATGARGN